MYARLESLRAQVAGTPKELRPELRNTIRTLERLLAETKDQEQIGETGDPVVDGWLRDLDEGRIPDLEAGIPRGILERHRR